MEYDNASILSECLKEMEAELNNQVFTWNDADYLCSPSITSATENLENGGFAVTKVLSLTARQCLFQGIFPNEQDLIVYQGEAYRVLTRNKDVMGVYLRLICTSDTRGI